MAYLVDTNLLVDFTRGSAGAADYLESLGEEWSVSAITCLELIAGARSQREVVDLHLLLSGCHSIPPNEDITRRADYLIKTYARSHGLQTLDALIAGTALEDDLVLATKNRKHFQMIRELRLEVPTY